MRWWDRGPRVHSSWTILRRQEDRHKDQSELVILLITARQGQDNAVWLYAWALPPSGVWEACHPDRDRHVTEQGVNIRWRGRSPRVHSSWT